MRQRLPFLLLAILIALGCGFNLLAQTVAKSLEPYLMLPEPSSLRSSTSMVPEGARRTVFTPAKEAKTKQGVETYSAEEFKKLGISVDAFYEKAKAAADRQLAQFQPEYIKDEQGLTRYAVFRGDSSLIASLIIAPKLVSQFSAIFGEEVWAALPDRHSLYIFPPKPELLTEFTDDLAARFHNDPFAASCEVFSLKAGRAPVVVADFGD